MAKKKTTTFQVSALLSLWISVNIEAATLEDALVQSKALKEGHFVHIKGDYNDGKMRIIGIYDNDFTIKV